MKHLIEAPRTGHHHIFLEGPAGAGKTCRMIQRLAHLITNGITGYSILVLVPDRSIGQRYEEALIQMELGAYGRVDIQTYYGLATRLVRTFWPLVAQDAGFTSPEKPPIFLTFETAQYVMDQLIAPRLAQGYFEDLNLRPQRIVSQLIDNLNKAAINGYSIETIEERLSRVWMGKTDRLRHYQQAQTCITEFRRHCLNRGLLDLSLTVEIFHRHLVNNPTFWTYFTGRYQHLLVDNLEESVPVAQDLIRRLLPMMKSAVVAYDTNAGFRVFLGIDAEGAYQIREMCTETITLTESETSNPHLSAFAGKVGEYLRQFPLVTRKGDPKKAIRCLIQETYRAKMIERVGQEITRLVRKGVQAGDIAVVAPYADGVLRFSLSEEFRKQDIPFQVVRRYESLQEEPIVRAALTIAALVHPTWDVDMSPFPHPYDVAEAITEVIKEIDPVRAALLVKRLYDPKTKQLKPASNIKNPERIGFANLERYDTLQTWICNWQQKAEIPFDHFLRHLFEFISQPELDPRKASVYAKLVASVEWFKEAAPGMGIETHQVGQHYLQMVYKGIISAQYLSNQKIDEQAVTLVAPVYSYLLSGHHARFQFWLDVGSTSWWEPPHQPLTNPHVLARRWDATEKWTDAVDYRLRQEALFKMVSGLTQRCRDGIYICTSDLEITGEPQDSPLLRAVQNILRAKK